MIFDSHIHTKVSFDSEMALEDALRRAGDLNLGLILTEHMDLDYPEKGQFLFDVPQYFNDYQAYRSDCCLLGVELGMQAACAERNKALAAGAAFDYVLGSIHLVGGVDLYYASFYEGKDKRVSYGQYFTAMLDCLRCHPFIDALGHIDYIARYGTYDDPEISRGEFSDMIDAVLRTAAENDIVLELNTRRLTDRGAAENLLPVYKRYRELGGRMVTWGSDAHDAKSVGGNFAAAAEITAACGLKPIYFKNRKIQYIRK